MIFWKHFRRLLVAPNFSLVKNRIRDSERKLSTTSLWALYNHKFIILYYSVALINSKFELRWVQLLIFYFHRMCLYNCKTVIAIRISMMTSHQMNIKKGEMEEKKDKDDESCWRGERGSRKGEVEGYDEEEMTPLPPTAEMGVEVFSARCTPATPTARAPVIWLSACRIHRLLSHLLLAPNSIRVLLWTKKKVSNVEYTNEGEGEVLIKIEKDQKVGALGIEKPRIRGSLWQVFPFGNLRSLY